MLKYWLKPDWEPGTSIHKIRKEELLTRNIKALLLDVDGTLLPRNKKLLESGTSNILLVMNNTIYSPKRDIYKGITYKFFKKKTKIIEKDIFLKKLLKYDEIILIGSGKGVVSVAKIENTSWKRKSLKIYHRLIKTYNNAIINS